jgi:hypothetical protein
MIHFARHLERLFSGTTACEVKSGNLFRMQSKVHIVRWRRVRHQVVLRLPMTFKPCLMCQRLIDRRPLIVLACFSRDVLPALEVP